MKKIILSIVSITTCLIMSVSSLAAPVVANNNYQKTMDVNGHSVSILKDTDQVKVTQASDNKGTYTVTYDKKNHTVQVDVTQNGKTTKGETVSAASLADQTDSTPDSYAARVKTYQNTICNFEWTKNSNGSKIDWQIRAPRNGFNAWYYKDLVENNSNRSDLRTYQSIVEDIDRQEKKIAASLSVALIMDFLAGVASAGGIISGGTLSGTAYAAIAGAVTANAVVIDLLIDYGSLMNRATDMFWYDF